MDLDQVWPAGRPREPLPPEQGRGSCLALLGTSPEPQRPVWGRCSAGNSDKEHLG